MRKGSKTNLAIQGRRQEFVAIGNPRVCVANVCGSWLLLHKNTIGVGLDNVISHNEDLACELNTTTPTGTCKAITIVRMSPDLHHWNAHQIRTCPALHAQRCSAAHQGNRRFAIPATASAVVRERPRLGWCLLFISLTFAAGSSDIRRGRRGSRPRGGTWSFGFT